MKHQTIILAVLMMAACSQDAPPAQELPTPEASATSTARPDMIPDALVDTDLTAPQSDFSADLQPMTMQVFRSGELPQETIQAMNDCIEATRTSGDTEKICVGLIMDTCPEDAFTTADMVACVGYEFDYWTDRLETAVDRLSELYSEDDDEFGEEGAISVSLTGMFTAAQEDWHEFRRSTCQLESMRFRGGTMGRVTGSTCMVELTAHQVIHLEDQILLFEDY